MRTVESLLAEASRRPSGEYTTPEMKSRWSARPPRASPVRASHTRSTLSAPPEATLEPSGDQATERTRDWLAWMVVAGVRPGPFHMRTVPSFAPLATCRPLGE